MTKRNTYISLIILCLTAIFIIQKIPSPSPKTILQQQIQLIPDKQKIINNPLPAAIFTLTYLILFITGITNLIFLFIKKSNNEPFLNIQEEIKPFPLAGEKSAKLIFFISLFIFLIYAAQNLANYLKIKKTSLIDISIILNTVIQTAVIFTVLKFLKTKFLGFNIKKIGLPQILKTYTAVIPLTIAALIINKLFVDKSCLPSSFNPVIDLFLALKNKVSLSLLLLQITLLAPLAEELLFRGVFYKILRKKYSWKISAVLISIFFAFIHGTPQDTLALFIISFALCYIYEKTQNIITPIIMHSIHNTLNISLLIILKTIM